VSSTELLSQASWRAQQCSSTRSECSAVRKSVAYTSEGRAPFGFRALGVQRAFLLPRSSSTMSLSACSFLMYAGDCRQTVDESRTNRCQGGKRDDS
jgi:hypothetical protein